MIIDKEKMDIKRRFFLKKMLKLFFTFVALIFSFLGLSLLKPANPKKKEYSYYEIPEDKIPKEGVKKINIEIGNLQKSLKIYLVNDGDSIIALSPVCTHLGCFVNFDKNSNEFICPCHGGKYDSEGKVLKCPPKEPLQRLPVKIENKKIFVGIKI
ncbi:ubiquinol-cytochrome c reductase iron-sulfur subunit [Thermodesulfovibrio yellowstonii]|uniref:Cytochrome b6-F complex iron-sulfur subunit n=1 Tax=Thermodesulfovibrio yellowstonii (strain ATCC 51303 / DSM 11347 / YP87) TaxID=289376 RepID=B5YL67_THEYD|nr:ubiquinol-cytochrome c reductase iron-sulfur subunit [Thermodesulfovibrio yellowstonii]ACI21166.1 cytochrome b6-F complex iron-sulfur subunit [Thermodesulfovibrio yellowstonii DSM 11347]